MKIYGNIPVSDDEAVFELCPRCDGDGYMDEFSDEVCRTCWGEGEIEVMDVPVGRGHATPR